MNKITMDESRLFQRATNPEQYDLEDLPWEKEGTTESPRTFFFWEYLQKYAPEWKEKDVLDIGCGNGWLLNEAVKLGAKSVLGVEPSNRNVALAKNHYPDIEIAQSAFENFDPKGKKFDVATSVMAFSHINNLDLAFDKLHEILRQKFFQHLPQSNFSLRGFKIRFPPQSIGFGGEGLVKD
jgi:2-polyprenyl-3-methyl-5-hydroxy-6-metoxy-1,4-benzoquinol methylase